MHPIERDETIEPTDPPPMGGPETVFVAGRLHKNKLQRPEKDGLVYLLKEDLKGLENERMYDPRSNLYSATFFYARLKDEIARAGRYRHFLSLILLNVDSEEGTAEHPVEKAVKEVGQEVMASVVRRTDILSHLRRSQIAIILPETDRAGADFVLERYRSMIAVRDYALKCAVLTYPEDASNIEMILTRIESISEQLERRGADSSATIDIFASDLLSVEN